MPTALVLGASRGIGLEFTRQYLQAGWQVLATHRTEAARLQLRALGALTYRLDVLDADDVASFAWQLAEDPVDVAVFNAGVYGPRDSTLRNAPSVVDFDQVMHSNVLAMLRLIPAVLPSVARVQGTAAFITSRMGSISGTQSSFGALYRISKAAANMVTQLAQADWAPQGVRVLALHPGWVRTDMGGPNAEVDVADAVTGLRSVVAAPGQYPGGQFLDYRGQRLDW